MATKARQGNGGASDEDEPLARRASYAFRRTRDFNAELQALDSGLRAAFAQKLLDFAREWRQCRSTAEIPKGFDYKPLAGSDAGRWKVKQIRLNGKFRAALTIMA